MWVGGWLAGWPKLKLSLAIFVKCPAFYITHKNFPRERYNGWVGGLSNICRMTTDKHPWDREQEIKLFGSDRMNKKQDLVEFINVL